MIIHLIKQQSMQNLINSLNAGVTEYKDGNVVLQHPPTATMRRAANTLAQLANINESNAQLLQKMQETIDTQLQEIETLTKELENERVQSLRNAEQQISAVESESSHPHGSDSNSEERPDSESNSTGSN